MINAALMRAIRGPIILITIGVLFAIDHAGGLTFDRTWPALIIVIGLLKLLERSTPGGYGPAYPNAPGWGQPYAGAPGYPPPPPAGATAQQVPPQAPAGDSGTTESRGGRR